MATKSPETGSDDQQPPFWQLEKHPHLLERAKTDDDLARRLDALSKAREIAANNPDNQALQVLPTNMEQAVSEYVQQWYGAWPPPDVEPGS